MSQALYRKWRPQTFDQVVGQEHITGTLRNAIAAGRISHAYLFTSPRGRRDSAAHAITKG